MINKYPSQYIQKSILVDILSKITHTDPRIHFLKKREMIIKEILKCNPEKILQYMSRDEFENLKKTKKEDKLPVFLTRDELSRMVEVTRTENDFKSQLMLLFAYTTGCRPGEIARTKIEDINFENKFVLLRQTKSKKQRIVYIFDDELLADLKKFISHRSKDEFLFLSRRQKPYTVKGITKKFRAIAQKAGIDPRKVSAHKIRHTHAVHAVERGVSLPSIRDQLGHSSIKVTDIYTRIADIHRKKDYQEHNPFDLDSKTELSDEDVTVLKKIVEKLRNKQN